MATHLEDMLARLVERQQRKLKQQNEIITDLLEKSIKLNAALFHEQRMDPSQDVVSANLGLRVSIASATQAR